MKIGRCVKCGSPMTLDKIRNHRGAIKSEFKYWVFPCKLCKAYDYHEGYVQGRKDNIGFIQKLIDRWF